MIYMAEVKEQLKAMLDEAFGYLWEDISTDDMRSRWIAGGRIRIFDLKSGSVLAERTGFYFARHLNGALTKYPWAGASGIRCPVRHSTSEFVLSVLVPQPTR